MSDFGVWLLLSSPQKPRVCQTLFFAFNLIGLDNSLLIFPQPLGNAMSVFLPQKKKVSFEALVWITKKNAYSFLSLPTNLVTANILSTSIALMLRCYLRRKKKLDRYLVSYYPKVSYYLFNTVCKHKNTSLVCAPVLIMDKNNDSVLLNVLHAATCIMF